VLTETPSPVLYACDPWSSRLELSHLGFGIVHSAHCLPDFSAALPIDPLLVLPFLVLNAGKPPHKRYTLVILGLPAWSPTFLPWIWNRTRRPLPARFLSCAP